VIHEIDGPSDVSIILATPDGDSAIVTTTEAAKRLTLGDVEAALSQAGLNDVLVLQGNLSLDMSRNTFEIGKRRGMLAAFNPSPVKAGFTELWPLLDIVILNEGEASELTGLPAEQAANAIRAAGPLSVVITLGARGCFLADENGLALVPAVPQLAVDSTGAGDTFMAVAIASAASRRCAVDRKAVTAATRAVAVTISKQGTRSSFPTREQIAAFLTA
jgi:ribokinase